MDEEREQDTSLKLREGTPDQGTLSNRSDSNSSVDDKEIRNHSIISGDLESIDLNDTSTDNLPPTVTDSPTSVHSSSNPSGKKKR